VMKIKLPARIGLVRLSFISIVVGLITGFGAAHRPLAIMLSADQVPINSAHSTMRGGKWVVLIAGSTGSALRAVCPFQPSRHAGCRRDLVHAASAIGSL
jgi:hypothetical protein